MPVLIATHCYQLPSFFTVSLWAQNLPFQKIISSNLFHNCFFSVSRTDLTALESRPFTGFLCLWIFMFQFYFFTILVISTCGRKIWPALRSTFGRTIIYRCIYLFISILVWLLETVVTNLYFHQPVCYWPWAETVNQTNDSRIYFYRERKLFYGSIFTIFRR